MKTTAGKVETLIELSLKDSEIRYRRLFEAAQDGILILDAATGMIEDVNPYLIKMLGYSREEFVERKLWEVGAFKDIEDSKDAFEALQEKEYIRYDDLPLKAKDGRLIQVEFVSNVYWVGNEKVIQCNIRDISMRKQAEAALHHSEERYRLLVETLPDGVVVHSQGRVVFANPAGAMIVGAVSPVDLFGKPVIEFVHPDYREPALKRIQDSLREGRSVPLMEEKFVRLDETVIDVEVSAVPFSYAGKPAMLTVFNEITRRKQAEERIQRQLEHLTALSTIDRFIAGNFNLELSLSEILKHVTVELGVDAADILILDSNSQMLKYGAERGFRTKAPRRAQVSLGESYAGRAAMERKLVQIPSLVDEPNNLLLTTLLAGEDFVCYYGVPLIAKGQVKGVVEIFHRSPLEPDSEWLDFLETLAGQAAIAIENAALFDNVQRSNSELMLAYETTLEGWSHALDLRDKETEGHTQRVTEMTVRLARRFGLSEAELVNVRRGGLLHDIGKMGVPDNILLKPGELTEEEWQQMRMHPVYAHDLLSHIAYLHDALDIPYGHHEKWDGTGYPRGLKGREIPLAARIFAVVDVWDALRSDRPYRPAWPEERVREHILASSGTQFDPQVVELFMQVRS